MDPKRYYKRWVRAAVELCGDPTSLTLTLKDGNTKYSVYLLGRDVEVVTYIKLRRWGWILQEDRKWKSCEPETKKTIGELAYQKVLDLAAATQASTGRVGEVSWSRGERPFFDKVDEVLPKEDDIRGGRRYGFPFLGDRV